MPFAPNFPRTPIATTNPWSYLAKVLNAFFGSFPQNPLTNIWRAAHQSSSFSFDDTQKPYDIRVHYRDVAQIQNFRFSAVAYLFLYFIESFGLDSADQPDDRGFAVGLPFNLQ
jgi:hypothetical protein